MKDRVYIQAILKRGIKASEDNLKKAEERKMSLNRQTSFFFSPMAGADKNMEDHILARYASVTWL